MILELFPKSCKELFPPFDFSVVALLDLAEEFFNDAVVRPGSPR